MTTEFAHREQTIDPECRCLPAAELLMQLWRIGAEFGEIR